MNRDRETHLNAEFEAAKAIIVALKDNGYKALLAGGCVRDRLLGKIPKDYDVATSATPDEVCSIFKRTKKVGAQFGVVLVSQKRQEIEVATFRSDGIYRDGRRPEEVVFTDAEHDAQRRDFTINGMFYDPVSDQLVDYVNGQSDISARIIRCIGEPSKRFAEDHLRLLRAVRFAATLDFAIEPNTFEAMRKHADQVAIVSPERIRAELALMLAPTGRSRAWQNLCDSNLCNHIIKGVQWDVSHRDAAQKTIDKLPDISTVALGFAAMFAPIFMVQVDQVRQACRAIRCSNEESDTICLLLKWSVRIQGDDELELADIKNMLASNHFDEICALASALENEAVQSIRQRAEEIVPEDAAPPPLLDGAFLLDQDIPQGPIYRQVIDAVYRAQLNERVSTVEQAQAMAMEIIRKQAD